ncbi:MAG: hypothetical protein V4515_01825 [Chloroflexota bacterium]
MTQIAVPAFDDLTTNQVTRLAITSASLAERIATVDGLAARYLATLADAVSAEETRRRSGRGLRLTVAMIDDADLDPAEVDASIRLALMAALSLREQAGGSGLPVGDWWHAAAVALVNAAEHAAAEVAALERMAAPRILERGRVE